MRYHVQLGTKRTTVTLDRILSELLAIKLGYKPDDAQTHTAVREWLQQQLDDAGDPNRIRTSQWLQEQAIIAIADKKISSKHDDWILS